MQLCLEMMAIENSRNKSKWLKCVTVDHQQDELAARKAPSAFDLRQLLIDDDNDDEEEEKDGDGAADEEEYCAAADLLP